MLVDDNDPDIKLKNALTRHDKMNNQKRRTINHRPQRKTYNR